MEHWDAITAERRALMDALDGLSPEQWDTPSLCGEWKVRHVLGHLLVPLKTSLPKFFVHIAKARGNFDRANSRLAVREGERDPSDVIADVRRLAEKKFKPPGFGSEAPLSDVLIHGMDMTLPLGIQNDRAAETFRPVLDLHVSKKATRVFGLSPLPESVRLVATDLDWTHGEGDDVEGAAADLALSLAGRKARADSLSGPGRDTFVAWLS